MIKTNAKAKQMLKQKTKNKKLKHNRGNALFLLTK
jgi:hypothetical protein